MAVNRIGAHPFVGVMKNNIFIATKVVLFVLGLID